MSNTIYLYNGSRQFTTLSNLTQEEITLTGSNRKFNRVIVLIHGFPDDNSTYKELTPYLEKAFPKALIIAPLLRGYEESSQGAINEYTPNDLAGDIRAWINNVDHSDLPVNVIAHDWGAVIAYRAIELFPNLIDSVVTLSIPHFKSIPRFTLLGLLPRQLYLSSYMLTMQFPSLYRYRFSTNYLENLWRYWSPSWNFTIEDIATVKARLVGANLDHATAYYRCAFNILNAKQYDNSLDFEKTPVLSLAGGEDGCMSRKLFELARNGVNFESRVLEGVGHFLHREDPERVAREIVHWLGAVIERRT